jgi:hypothetical protein
VQNLPNSRIARRTRLRRHSNFKFHLNSQQNYTDALKPNLGKLSPSGLENRPRRPTWMQTKETRRRNQKMGWRNHQLCVRTACFNLQPLLFLSCFSLSPEFNSSRELIVYVCHALWCVHLAKIWTEPWSESLIEPIHLDGCRNTSQFSRQVNVEPSFNSNNLLS